MVDQPDRIDDLWCEYLDGTLDVERARELLAALLADTSRRDVLLGDEQIHRLLRHSAAAATAGDDRAFVDRCVSALAGMTPAIYPASPRKTAPDPAIAAPPVVSRRPRESAPPVAARQQPAVRVRTPRTSRDQRFRKPSVGVRLLAVTVLAGLLVAVAITATLLVPEIQDSDGSPQVPAIVNQPITPDRRPVARPEPPVSVARLRPAAEVVWAGDKPPADLLAGSYDLLEGRVSLEFPDGPIVQIEGPARFELDSPGELNVHRGHLTASSAAPKSLVLVTPTSRVLDLGGECHLAVEDSGTTEVQIRRGGAVVEPSTAGRDWSGRWKLGAAALNRVTVFAPADESKTSPLASVAEGDHGQFSAAIASRGEMIEFRSPRVFDAIRQQVVDRYRTSPEEFSREWSDFVTRSATGEFEGSVEVNGEASTITDWEDMFAAADKLFTRDVPRNPDGSPPTTVESTSRFHGTIRIKGKMITFDSVEEFEKARKELFGPFDQMQFPRR